MPKKSDYLRKQQERDDMFLHLGETIEKQYMADTLQIALHRQGWGYDRLAKLMQEWDSVRAEFRPALDYKNVEADYKQEKMDAEIKDIVKKNDIFVDFQHRYPELKKVTYGGKK